MLQLWSKPQGREAIRVDEVTADVPWILCRSTLPTLEPLESVLLELSTNLTVPGSHDGAVLVSYSLPARALATTLRVPLSLTVLERATPRRATLMADGSGLQVEYAGALHFVQVSKHVPKRMSKHATEPAYKHVSLNLSTCLTSAF